jgi:hypothetical protein
MKYLIGFILIAFFASCEKQTVDLNIENKPAQSSKISYFYSKVYTTNNHSSLKMPCDVITMSISNDTIMARIKLYKATNDYTLITAIVTDTNSANITQFTDYMPASLPSTATKVATGKIIFNTTSCNIDIVYLSGNSQQFIGK